MRFIFGKQDSPTLERAQERCWLLANGLGGYMSASAAFSVTRRDQSILMAAVTPPAKRVNLVHRLSETLAVGERWEFLSTQVFADGREPEKGYRHLSAFVWDGAPSWLYHVEGVQVRRQCAVEYGGQHGGGGVHHRKPLLSSLHSAGAALYAGRGPDCPGAAGAGRGHAPGGLRGTDSGNLRRRDPRPLQGLLCPGVERGGAAAGI